MRHDRQRTRGFMFGDAVMGLMIIGVIAVAIMIALNRHQRATISLAQQRGAVWAAERALAELQAGGESPIEREDDVQIERIEAGPAPAGYAWVRVRALHEGRSATLIGLVPAGASAQGGR